MPRAENPVLHHDMASELYQPFVMAEGTRKYSDAFIEETLEAFGFAVPSEEKERIYLFSRFEYAAREYEGAKYNLENRVKAKNMKAAFREMEHHAAALLELLEHVDSHTWQLLNNTAEDALRYSALTLLRGESSSEAGELMRIGALKFPTVEGGTEFIDLQTVAAGLRLLLYTTEKAQPGIPKEKGGRPSNYPLRRWFSLMENIWHKELGNPSGSFTFDFHKGKPGGCPEPITKAGEFLVCFLAPLDPAAIGKLPSVVKKGKKPHP